MATKTKATPSQRARARRDPAIFQPPSLPKRNRNTVVRTLTLRVGGRAFPIGPNIDGDTPWSMGMDQSATVTLPVRDPSRWLPRQLDDERLLQQDGARVTIEGIVYTVSGIDADGDGLYTLTMEDEVAWRLRDFTSFRSASRATTTRFGFIYSFVREASRSPLPPMRSFIPEVDDKQLIRKPVLDQTDAPSTGSGSGSKSGTGAGAYKVKGKRATARQRATIDGILTQASKDGASRRVMIAAIMAATQESVMGEEQNADSGTDDVGIYHQGRNWISADGAKDPEKATHAFLVTGPTSWKKVHGGLKKAPGDLNAAIVKVQISVGGYGQWLDESTATVDAWLESGGAEDAGSYTKSYHFSRGERRGQRESSWDAAARLVEEVGAYRWAAGNVFYAVSGNELRRAKSALMIHGDEGWLLKEPSWSWASRRSISEMSMDVLADHWSITPGGIVEMHRDLGPMSGKWMVWNVSGASLDSPESTVVLRRPTRLKTEPAAETAERSGDGSKGTVEKLLSVCKEISGNRTAYVYGGGHGPAVKTLQSSSHMDCSSSVSLALYRAGFFDGSKPAYTSGTFASTWGSAGKGEEFTVWANATHVWLEFADGSRFDTSQHSGESGPMYTTKKRTDQGRFTPRHIKGH